MRKGNKYKLFSKINTIIAVTMVAIMVLGVSYGYWSDSLTVNAEIGTGKLMVEGVMKYEYPGLCEYPNHTQHNNCAFHEWWAHQSKEGNVNISGINADKSPVQVQNLSLEVVSGNGQTVGYKGKGDIVFTVKNTGTVPATVSLNPSANKYEKTWLKFSAPLNGGSNLPGDRAVLSQVEVNATDQSFYVDKGQGFGSDTVKSFSLNPLEEATVKIVACELEIDEYFKIEEYDLTKARIEAQVSVVFQDVTNQWRGNTCNSLFVNEPIGLEFKYCKDCIKDCKGSEIPLGINLNDVLTCDDYRKKYPDQNMNWHCSDKCGCKKNNILVQDIMKPTPLPEIPEGPAGSVGNLEETPTPLPAPMPEIPEGPVDNPTIDIPVTLPLEDEELSVVETPVIIPVE